jgi:hypothetical protein
VSNLHFFNFIKCNLHKLIHNNELLLLMPMLMEYLLKRTSMIMHNVTYEMGVNGLRIDSWSCLM